MRPIIESSLSRIRWETAPTLAGWFQLCNSVINEDSRATKWNWAIEISKKKKRWNVFQHIPRETKLLARWNPASHGNAGSWERSLRSVSVHARPLVGVDDARERKRERDRRGVGGIEVYVICVCMSVILSLSLLPSLSPFRERDTRTSYWLSLLLAHAIGIDGDSLSRPFAFSIRKFRFPLEYDIDTGYLSAGAACSFAGARRKCRGNLTVLLPGTRSSGLFYEAIFI